MVKQHLIRIAAPRTWQVHRKQNVFMKRPNAGGHTMEYGISLVSVLRDHLGYAETMKEVKHIIKNQKITINGNRAYDDGALVGFMDVLGIEGQKQYFRLLINDKSKLFLHPIPASEKDTILGKVQKKTVQKKNVMTGHLNNGYNVPVKGSFKTGDVMVLERKKKCHEATTVLPYTEKSMVYVFGGKNVGTVGVIKEIKKQLLRQDRVFVIVGKDEFECVGKHTFIIGKEKPAINLPIKDNKIQ